MGVERKHGDARLHDPEILLERRPEPIQTTHDPVFGQARADLRDGNMDGRKPHAQHLAAHHHQGLASQLGSQEFGVSGMGEFRRMDGFLVERSRHQGVDLLLAQVGDSPAQGLDRRPARFRGADARLDGGRLAARHEVHPSPAGFAGRADGLKHRFLEPLDRISVIGGRSGRSVDYGRTQLRHARIGKGLEDDLPADAVGVALRDAYSEFRFGHKYNLFQLTNIGVFSHNPAPDAENCRSVRISFP